MHKLRISYIKVEDFLFHDDFHKSIIYHFFHNLTSILHFIKNKYFIFQRIQVYYLYKDLNNCIKIISFIWRELRFRLFCIIEIVINI